MLSPDRIFPSSFSISYGRDVFVLTREDFVVWARQGKPYGYNPILDGMDNFRYNSFRPCRVVQWSNDQRRACWTCAMLLFIFLKAHKLLEAFASGYGCQDDCSVEGRPGGTGGDSRDASRPSSTRLKVTEGTQSEFTGFGAQYGPHTLSLSSGRRSLCLINLGCPKTKN